jgi:hypothetical protein
MLQIYEFFPVINDKFQEGGGKLFLEVIWVYYQLTLLSYQFAILFSAYLALESGALFLTGTINRL